MQHHSIMVLMGDDDAFDPSKLEQIAQFIPLQVMTPDHILDFGMGRFLQQLEARGLYPSETSIDLLLLASVVSAADAKIPRAQGGPDGWTRHIDLHVPVLEPGLWQNAKELLQRTLKFLTGDIWQLHFRKRPTNMQALGSRPRVNQVRNSEVDCVCLFSGGLDSYVGAIDLLADDSNPYLVSYHKDASTSRQRECLAVIRGGYSTLRHTLPSVQWISARIQIDKRGLPTLGQESSTRGRSFLFFALAAIVSDGIKGDCPIFVPENGFISLNVPLDPLRIGTLSTRTTHPHYMAGWSIFAKALGLDVTLENPYQFKTKGQMLKECRNQDILVAGIESTMSCSSCVKARFHHEGIIHCGYCVPCLIRRAAIKAGLGMDITPYWKLDPIDDTLLRANEEMGKHVRGFRTLVQWLDQNPQLAYWLVRQSGPLVAVDKGGIEKYTDVLERGLAEIKGLVNQARFETR